LPPTTGDGREPIYHYVIVRRDLSLGLLAAMCVHAAGESSPGGLPEDTHAVVLAADGEAALVALAEKLALAKVEHVVIREPDLGNAMMAIGLRPGRKEALRRHLSSLPLLR
jgi:hypothetical protein